MVDRDHWTTRIEDNEEGRETREENLQRKDEVGTPVGCPVGWQPRWTPASLLGFPPSLAINRLGVCAVS